MSWMLRSSSLLGLGFNWSYRSAAALYGQPRRLQVTRTWGPGASAELSTASVAKSIFDTRSSTRSKCRKDDLSPDPASKAEMWSSNRVVGFPTRFPTAAAKHSNPYDSGVKRGSAWGSTPEHGLEKFVLGTSITSKLPWG